MKKWIWIPLIMALILSISCQGQSQEEVPPVAQQIAEKNQQAVQSYKDDKVIEINWGQSPIISFIDKTGYQGQNRRQIEIETRRSLSNIS